MKNDDYWWYMMGYESAKRSQPRPRTSGRNSSAGLGVFTIIAALVFFAIAVAAIGFVIYCFTFGSIDFWLCCLIASGILFFLFCLIAG